MILFFSAYYPCYSRGGAQVRAATLLDHLHAAGQTIHLVVASRRPAKAKGMKQSPPFIDRASAIGLAGRPLSGIMTIPLAKATRPAQSMPVRLLQSAVDWIRRRPDVLDEVAQLVERLCPEVLWVNSAHLMPLIARVPRQKGQVRIVDTLDVMHQRDASLRQAGLPPECGVSREEEIALLDQFDVVLAIQDEERRVLQQMLPSKQVMTVRHACVPNPRPTSRPAVVFIGSNGPTNLQGIETFIEQAWPRVLQVRPDAQLEVVGSVCQAESLRRAAAQAGQRIVLRGSLPQIAHAYDGPAVVICPLWAGSGLKIKMVEALCHAKAVVGSPIAAQGLEDGIGTAFWTAETPMEFAAAVLRLLENEPVRAALATGGLAYATSRFGPAAVYGELVEILRTRQAAEKPPSKAA